MNGWIIAALVAVVVAVLSVWLARISVAAGKIVRFAWVALITLALAIVLLELGVIFIKSRVDSALHWLVVPAFILVAWLMKAVITWVYVKSWGEIQIGQRGYVSFRRHAGGFLDCLNGNRVPVILESGPVFMPKIPRWMGGPWYEIVSRPIQLEVVASSEAIAMGGAYKGERCTAMANGVLCSLTVETPFASADFVRFVETKMDAARAELALKNAMRGRIARMGAVQINRDPDFFCASVEADLRLDSELLQSGIDPADIRVKQTLVKVPSAHEAKLTARAGAEIEGATSQVDSRALAQIVRRHMKVWGLKLNLSVPHVGDYLALCEKEREKFDKECADILNARRYKAPAPASVVVRRDNNRRVRNGQDLTDEEAIAEALR